MAARRQAGFLLIAVILFVFMLSLTAFLSQSGMLIAYGNKNFSKTQGAITNIQERLINFASVYGRLPCPANPALDASAALAGFPDQDANIAMEHGSCAYPAGVVPWAALGLKPSDVSDEWGRLISYRVYDGVYGLTQDRGASASDCDTDNEGTLDVAPTTQGLCNDNHETLRSMFVSYDGSLSGAAPFTFEKGLVLNRFGGSEDHLAFILVSHGASGRGGYDATGSRIAVPDVAAVDYPNTQVQAAPAAYISAASSDPSIAAGASGHFDDVLGYLKIDDLLRLAARDAKPWAENSLPSFTPPTTADMTSPSTNPSAPHFMSSGASGSGQEFTITFTPDEPLATAVQFGNATGFYAGCLWWPNVLPMTNGSSRTSLTTYVEFAAADNASDAFPGFTMGFLSGAGAIPPTNNTCGTTIAASATTTGNTDARTFTVADASGVIVGHDVFGPGIDPDSKVASVSGVTVVLDRDLLGSFVPGGQVSFGDSRLIRRDLGWAGGTLSTFTSNRFAVEFDSRVDSGIPNALDPSRPHLAVDFAGVVHNGTNAHSCATTGSGQGCDRELLDFPGVSKNVTGASGVASITITNGDLTNVVNGMTVSGTGIAFGARVTKIVGNVAFLTQANTSDVSGAVTFNSLATNNFMQNGTDVFHKMRTEISPKDCVATSGAGVSGAMTVNVGSAAKVESGMAAYGNGIATGAKVQGVAGDVVSLDLPHAANVSGQITFGGDLVADTTATGLIGSSNIEVASADGIAVGMTAFGTGISSGATVVSFSGTTITLSSVNVGNVSGAVTFAPGQALTRTLVKSWTLSNAGCNQDPILCNAIKNIATRFTSDIGANRQVLHAVSCIPESTPSTALDSLYFGLTTANRSKGNTVVTTTGNGSSGSNNVVVVDATGIQVGMYASATGIAGGAIVTGIVGTTVTLSRSNTALVGGPVSFIAGANVIFRNLAAQRAVSP